MEMGRSGARLGIRQAMSEPTVRINLARGLTSLVDQATQKLKAKMPLFGVPFDAMADIVKQSIQENPDIPKQDITAVELVRRAGVLPERPRDKFGRLHPRKSLFRNRRRRA